MKIASFNLLLSPIYLSLSSQEFRNYIFL